MRVRKHLGRINHYKLCIIFSYSKSNQIDSVHNQLRMNYGNSCILPYHNTKQKAAFPVFILSK